MLCEHIISVRRKLHMTTGPRGGTYTLTKKYTCLCVTRPWAHRPARRGALHTRTDRTHIYTHMCISSVPVHEAEDTAAVVARMGHMLSHL